MKNRINLLEEDLNNADRDSLDKSSLCDFISVQETTIKIGSDICEVLKKIEEVTSAYFALKQARVKNIMDQEVNILEIEIRKIISDFANNCKIVEDLEESYKKIDVVYLKEDEVPEIRSVNKKGTDYMIIVYLLIITVILVILYIIYKN